MRKNKRKISKCLAIASIVTFLFSSFPINAYADEEIDIEIVQSSIDEAQIEVAKIEEEPFPIGDLLTGAEEDLSNLNENLSTYSNSEDVIEQAQTDIANAVNEIGTLIVAEENALEEFDSKDIDTTRDANNTIKDAGIANTSDSKDEAYAAADKARKELAVTEVELVSAEQAYSNASSAVDNIQTQYNNADKAYQKAQEEFSTAAEALRQANVNAKDAYDKLKEAKEKMDSLEAEMQQYADNLDELTTIQNQYYDLMVYYYRAYLGSGKNNVVYDTDGHVLMEENAALMHEKGLDQEASDTIKTGITPLGRYMTGLLTTYMISNMEDVDASTITFGKDLDPNGNKQAGVLTQDKYGHDRVLLNKDAGAAEITEEDEIYWHKSTQGDKGRTNYVVVTYQKKDDPTIYSLKYNYIIKDGNSEGEKDIADGMFYLAQITEKDGKVVYERVDDKNNLDSLSKIQEELNKAIIANETIQDYEAAKEAVDKAENEVKALQEQINKLQTSEVNEEILLSLQNTLEEAQGQLAKAKEKKDILERKVEEARRAVAGIDLSRFDTTEEETEEEDIVPQQQPNVNNNPITPINPVQLTNNNEEHFNVIDRNDNNEEIVQVQNPTLTIEDEDTALADSIEAEKEVPANSNSNALSYLWLLLLLLLIIILIILKIIYDKNKKKNKK